MTDKERIKELENDCSMLLLRLFECEAILSWYAELDRIAGIKNSKAARMLASKPHKTPT